MSDEWVDPRIGNPWLQGLPTQGDIQANEFGMGEFTFDPDALEQREDLHEQLLDYLKIRGIYLEDIIPNLPQEVERPDADWVPYTSDFLETYRNDDAYNMVATLVDDGMGYEDALLAVEQEAMEKGWGMPMLNSDNRQVQYYNGQPQLGMTEGEFKAQQAAQQATAAGGKLHGDPTKDAWTVFLDSGAIIQNPDGTFVPAPSSGFDMDEFDSNAEEFLTERALEQRSLDEREAALKQYEDYVKPRYLIDVESMEKNGLLGAKTDYAVEWEDDVARRPPDTPGGRTGPGQQPAAAPPSASLEELPGGPTLGGFGDQIATYEQSMKEVEENYRAEQDAKKESTAPQSSPTDLPGGRTQLNQTWDEWRRADSQSRTRKNNQQVNATNLASQERMNTTYQKLLQDYKRDNAVASEQQQRYSMLDEFMGAYYRGGA